MNYNAISSCLLIPVVLYVDSAIYSLCCTVRQQLQIFPYELMRQAHDLGESMPTMTWQVWVRPVVYWLASYWRHTQLV